MKSLTAKLSSARGWALPLTLFFGAGLMVAACWDDDPPTTPAPTPPPPPPEPEPPMVPVGLRIAARGVDFIEWSWTPVEAVSGYDVQYSANEAFTDQDEIVARTAEEVSYRREGLDPETTGYLRVRSASGSGEDRVTSDWSPHLSAMTMATPPPPMPPATPTGLMVSGATETSITWTWNVVEGAVGYVVQASMDELFDSTETVMFDGVPYTTDTNYTATGLEPETTVYVRVAAASGTTDAPLVSAFHTHVTGMTLAAEPERPPAPIPEPSLPTCIVGLALQSGDGCLYPNMTQVRVDLPEGSYRTLSVTIGTRIWRLDESAAIALLDIDIQTLRSEAPELVDLVPDDFHILAVLIGNGWTFFAVGSDHVVCTPGLVLRPGDGCLYPHTKHLLTVFDEQKIDFLPDDGASITRSGGLAYHTDDGNFASFALADLLRSSSQPVDFPDDFRLAARFRDGRWTVVAVGGDFEDSVRERAILTERALVDRPDETSGWQLHGVYMIPRDGVDQSLDVNGWIADAVAAGMDLIHERTGRHLRLDTYNGELDVTFVRHEASEAEFRRFGRVPNFDIGSRENKVYVVFFHQQDEESAFTGEGEAWLWADLGGLDAPGQQAVIVLGGYIYWSPDEHGRGVAHEVFHILGAVQPCAPHHDGTGHVHDSEDDLLTLGYEVDVGRDDYYGHDIPGCWDTEDSPLWGDATNRTDSRR